MASQSCEFNSSMLRITSFFLRFEVMNWFIIHSFFLSFYFFDKCSLFFLVHLSLVIFGQNVSLCSTGVKKQALLEVSVGWWNTLEIIICMDRWKVCHAFCE